MSASVDAASVANRGPAFRSLARARMIEAVDTISGAMCAAKKGGDTDRVSPPFHARRDRYRYRQELVHRSSR
jgi:hypothetical protein